MKKLFQRLKEYFCRVSKQLLVVLILLVSSTACMGLANGIQHGWGKVDIETGSIETTLFDDSNTKVNLGYKLYIPKTASSSAKAPAVLCLHGYQNDHETSAAYALELAKRGVVALCIDEYGHGSTNAGMVERGYVNHKVTTNYGYDSFEDLNYLEIGGVTRYKVMMNFSNLDFFKDLYSKSQTFTSNGKEILTATVDNEAMNIRDASMGGSAAYAWLSSLDYVDSSKMAVTGHSMGTWAAWSVAAAYSGTTIEPRATALQCGELFKCVRDESGRLAYDQNDDGIADISFNNVLLVTAKYDEFNYFRDYISTPVFENTIKESPQRLNFLNVSANDAKWNTTFHEDFAAGTSVRCQYVVTNHRLTTHDHRAVAAILSWFSSSFGGFPSTLDVTSHSYMVKEVLVFVAMLIGIASAVAMAMLMKNIRFFAPVFQDVPNRPEKIKSGWKFWKGAILTALISAFTYPFLCQLGHGLMPLPEHVFKMTIGNGFLVWYLFLIIVMLAFTLIPYFRNKKKGKENFDYVDIGLSRDDEAHRHKLDWVLFGKAALVALIGVFWMYLQVVVYEALFALDYRFIWPFFKGFSLTRFGQFLVYIPVFALFFILNNSRIFAASRVAHTEQPGIKAFFKCWWKYAFMMVGGILILCLLEYIPFFLQLGPGADLLFGTTFGGPFMSLLIVFAPQVIVFSFVCTYCYRKTGSVYVGALMVAMLACWIVTGGSAMLYF